MMWFYIVQQIHEGRAKELCHDRKNSEKEGKSLVQNAAKSLSRKILRYKSKFRMYLSTLLISSGYSWLDFESEIYSILNVTNVESTIHNIFYCHEHDSFKSWTLHAVYDVMSQSLVIAFIRWKSSQYLTVEN